MKWHKTRSENRCALAELTHTDDAKYRHTHIHTHSSRRHRLRPSDTSPAHIRHASQSTAPTRISREQFCGYVPHRARVPLAVPVVRHYTVLCSCDAHCRANPKCPLIMRACAHVQHPQHAATVTAAVAAESAAARVPAAMWWRCCIEQQLHQKHLHEQPSSK